MTDATITTTTTKATKTKNECWCGCGGLTANRFVPGHDARFHSQAKQVARGTLDEDTLPPLPCDEAAEEFQRHVALERPKHAAKVAAKAAADQAKANAKAAKEQAKADAAKAKEDAKADTKQPDALLSLANETNLALAS